MWREPGPWTWVTPEVCSVLHSRCGERVGEAPRCRALSMVMQNMEKCSEDGGNGGAFHQMEGSRRRGLPGQSSQYKCFLFWESQTLPGVIFCDGLSNSGAQPLNHNMAVQQTPFCVSTCCDHACMNATLTQPFRQMVSNQVGGVVVVFERLSHHQKFKTLQLCNGFLSGLFLKPPQP